MRCANKCAGACGLNRHSQFGWLEIKPAKIFGEFDSGSERTLAAWIRHASRTGSLR